MLLPANACEIIDTWTVGGLRGTGSHDVAATNVFVPNEFGSGFTDPHILPQPRYRIPPFSRVIPWPRRDGPGIARTAIECFTEIAGAKTPAAHDPDARATTTPRRFASRQAELLCARRGCSCSTASIAYGPRCSQREKSRCGRAPT